MLCRLLITGFLLLHSNLIIYQSPLKLMRWWCFVCFHLNLLTFPLLFQLTFPQIFRDELIWMRSWMLLFTRLNCSKERKFWALYLLTYKLLAGQQGRRQEGEGEISPSPETEKNCFRKIVLFPKALFLVTNFRKK